MINNLYIEYKLLLRFSNMQLTNMSKNSAAHQKKVEHAARKLLNRWTGGAGVTRGDATTSRMRDGD